MTTASSTENLTAEALGLRVGLKGLVECCLLVEEGIGQIKDVDLGLMMGAGVLPGPFMRADFMGLDVALEAIEKNAAGWGWGDDFKAPLLLKRLVRQGRLGQKVGQGFYAYPQPDADFEQRETVLFETRGNVAVAWLNRPPVNPISAQLIEDLAAVWAHAQSKGVRAFVLASGQQFAFSVGADLKSVAGMERAEIEKMVDQCHELLCAWEQSSIATIAAVNSLALGGGCELAIGTDIRIAASSASFGLPEITLGILPGFGGTQRLPRLVGQSKALEMMLTGDPVPADEAYGLGLVNQVVDDHELFDTALAWANKLAAQAPLSVGAIKEIYGNSHLDKGIAAEKEAFARVASSQDGKEGVSAFLEKRKPKFQGK